MNERTGGISQAEVQRSLNQATGQFMSRINQAMLEGWGASPRVQQAMVRQHLVYTSAAVEIATGQLPEANLLDMMVFMTLCRQALEEHVVPKIPGTGGQGISRAFGRSERDVWGIAGRVMSTQSQQKLMSMTRKWRTANPTRLRVEGVRLLDFGGLAGVRADQARGLLADVMARTGAADQTLLLAERAVFLLHRLPFLLRAQARIGPGESGERLADAASYLARADRLLAKADAVDRVLGQVVSLAKGASALTRQACDQAKKENPLVPETLRALRSAGELVERTARLLQQVEGLAGAAAVEARGSTRRVTR